MLNKRFKIAKCKTSLKLATSRIKLMRNKKVIQINQMKKELAQLLESQQDRTARIRVEHVIREEKMVAAYDLIEIYCELIVARLPIIESQKSCPIDLKEAVTSVIFAAPRCSDIPELADARKNFTAKYGKEFVSAATELRPDCGVSRMLVEKLSAVAPDVQTKMKVLTAVAKEHNINWDPTSFEEKESKPPDDLLNGPTNIEKASTMSVDPPKIQTTSVLNVPRHEGNTNVPPNFTQQNRRYTSNAQNITTVDTGSVQTSFSSTTHDDVRLSGMAPGMMNTSQSFHSNKNEPWNMEFKDATSAAHAAAESAERASIAARAAAQLSSQGKITRQYSTESHESHTRHEKPQVLYNNININNSSFSDRKPKIQNQQMGTTEDDISPKANKKSSSLRSRRESVNESAVNHFNRADGYFETHEDHVPSPKMSSKNKSKDQFTSSDMLNSDPRKVGQKFVVDKGSHSRVTTKTSSYGDARKDDETDSDDDGDGPRFDTGFEYDEGEAKSFFPSPERESFRLTEKTQVSGPKKNTINTTGQVKISKSTDYSLQSDLSDGPDSGSEDELENSRFSSTKKFTTSHKHDVFSTNPVPTHAESPPKVNSRKSRVELNDLVKTGQDSESEKEMGKSSFSSTKNFPTPRKHAVFSNDPQPAHVDSSPKFNPRKSRVELNDLVKTGQDSESEKEMGKLSFSSTKFTTPHKHDVFATNSEPAHVEFSPKAHSRKSRVELNDLVKTGRDSESENEIGKSSFSSTKFTTPHKHDAFSTHHKPSHEESSPKANSRKSRIELNDLVKTGQDSESDSETGNSSIGVTKKLTSPHKHGVFSTNLEPTYIESSPKANSRKSRVELNDSVETGSSFKNQSDVLDTGSDFKYGTLTGGLRNKGGLMHPPYTKIAVKESPVKVDSTSKQSSFNKKPSVSIGSESDSDDYSEKVPVQPSKTRSHFAPPDVFFNTDETDSEEEVTPVRKQTYTNKVHSGSGLSRRTKGQVEPVSKTVISSQSPRGPRSEYTKNFKENPDTNRESLETSSTSAERQQSTSSNSTKAHLETRPDPARVKQEPSRPDPARVKQEPSRADPARFKQEPSRPDPEHFKKEHSRPDPARFNKEDSRTMSEPKISEKPQIPPRKVQESGKAEGPKTANSSSNTSPEASNVKKPSHVHPKLPDYDSLAARIQALSKMNH